MLSLRRKELNRKAKPKGLTRKITCKCIKNIYFVDLIDFSSKQDSFVKECIKQYYEEYKTKQKSNFLTGNDEYKYVLVCVDGYSRYVMTKLLREKSSHEVYIRFKEILDTLVFRIIYAAIMVPNL